MWVACGSRQIAYSKDGTTWTGLGTFNYTLDNISYNTLRPNTITFNAGNTTGIASGTDIIINNKNARLEVVSDGYYQEGLISISVSL
jgi:hypothetical protein